MNVLVTGATGYAGFHAAIALRGAGHSVFALVRRGDSDRAKRLLQEEVRLVIGDLKRPETYRAALTRCDALVHTVMDHEDPQGADNALFDAMNSVAQEYPKSRRFLYTTGCSIYGKVPERVMDETTPGNPAHFLYFRMEMEARVLGGLMGWRKTVVRPGFMYGKEAHNSMSGVWFGMGERGEAVFRGDRDKGWSWVHIHDLADAYVRIVEAGPVVDGEIFCLADEQRPRCLEVMTAVCVRPGFRGTSSSSRRRRKTGRGPCSIKTSSSHRARRAACWTGRRATRGYWTILPPTMPPGRPHKEAQSE